MPKAQEVKTETRGRKKNPRTIGKNGLFVEQWERIQVDAQKQGLEGVAFLRQIVDFYYAQKDLEIEKEEYSTKEKFETLPKE